MSTVKKLIPEWVERTIHKSPYYIGVCVCQEQFESAMRKLKILKHDWSNFSFGVKHLAETSFYEETNGTGKAAIICFNPDKHEKINSAINSCAHEAQHVWRRICLEIGETEPSEEFAAYAIGNLTDNIYLGYQKALEKYNKKQEQLKPMEPEKQTDTSIKETNGK